MDELIKELEVIINKELYQGKVINFDEFKIMNESLLKGKEYEYIKN